MVCSNCGQKDETNAQFCMKCGQPLQANEAPDETPEGDARQTGAPAAKGTLPRHRRALPIAVAVSVVLLAVVVLLLVLSANPVAGTWYSQGGTELIFLKNGKGMTVPDGDIERIHFMYAIEYRESGYIEGEIYEREDGPSTWFYLYDGKLEFGGETFYRHTVRMG